MKSGQKYAFNIIIVSVYGREKKKKKQFISANALSPRLNLFGLGYVIYLVCFKLVSCSIFFFFSSILFLNCVVNVNDIDNSKASYVISIRKLD